LERSFGKLTASYTDYFKKYERYLVIGLMFIPFGNGSEIEGTT
jgi:hypothetical protein